MGKEKFCMGKGQQKNHKYQCDVIQVFSLIISLGYTCKNKNIDLCRNVALSIYLILPIYKILAFVVDTNHHILSQWKT